MEDNATKLNHTHKIVHSSAMQYQYWNVNDNLVKNY